MTEYSIYQNDLKQKLVIQPTFSKNLLTENDCKYLLDVLNRYDANEGMHCKLAHAPKIEKVEESATKRLEDVSIQTDECEKSESYYLQNQDKSEIDKMMSKTFDERRDYILYKGPRIRAIRDAYPALFEKNQLLAEFSRITKSDIVQSFHQRLELHCDVILQSAQPTCVAKKTLNNLRDASQTAAQTEEEKKYMNFTAAILSLPSLFKENVSKIIQFKTVKCNTDYPVITCKLDIKEVLSGDASFNVYAEKILLCTCNDFIDSFLVYMASFYVFDIFYPDAIVQSTTLTELLLLGLEPEPTNMCTSVEEVHKMLLLLQGSENSNIS